MTNLEQQDIKIVAEQQYDWNKLTNKTILISGGTGFVGRFIIEVLRYRNKIYHQGIKVISLSRRGGKSDDMVKYMSVDINQKIDIDENIDYILHMASNTHPKQYSEDPIGTITTNIYGCNNLLQLAVRNHIKRFLFTSSVEIYGEGSKTPMSEAYAGYIDCNNARSGYNESKRTCEALCQSYRMQYGVDSVIVRLARVFGADTKKDSKAMSQFMEKAVLGEDIILKSKGLQRYSYCYVADAASAIINVLISGKNGESYNVADEDENMTLGEYAEYIAGLSDRKVIMQIEDNKSVSKAMYALLDTSKIKKIGWKPIYSVSDALNKTFLIYQERNQSN